MGSILLGLISGGLTTLSPCVLPVLPIVLLGAIDGHRFGPIALAGGLATTFSVLGIALSGASWALDFPANAVRLTAAVLMVLFGMVLLSAALQQRFAALAAPLSCQFERVLGRQTSGGLAGQFALGAVLGAVWTPCSGPTLGAAISLAAAGHGVGRAATIMFAFGIGATLPLMAIAYGSRQTLRSRRDLLLRFGQAAKPLLGMVMLFSGALVLTGLDRVIEAQFVRYMPEWLIAYITRY